MPAIVTGMLDGGRRGGFCPTAQWSHREKRSYVGEDSMPGEAFCKELRGRAAMTVSWADLFECPAGELCR